MYINPVSNTNQSQSSFKSLKYVGKAYEKMLGEINPKHGKRENFLKFFGT